MTDQPLHDAKSLTPGQLSLGTGLPCAFIDPHLSRARQETLCVGPGKKGSHQVFGVVVIYLSSSLGEFGVLSTRTEKQFLAYVEAVEYEDALVKAVSQLQVRPDFVAVIRAYQPATPEGVHIIFDRRRC